MKKMLLTAFCMLCIMSCTGCINTDIQNEPQGVEQQTETVEKKPIKVVGNNPPTDVTDFEPLGRYEFDIDEDGTEDIFTLYTSAQRDVRGDLMWDDSQIWILQAELADGVHDLFSQRISGKVYMNVSDYYNSGEEEKVITLIVSSNASHEVREYRYDDKLDGACFTETMAFTTDDVANEGINNLYSSIPSYK